MYERIEKREMDLAIFILCQCSGYLFLGFCYCKDIFLADIRITRNRGFVHFKIYRKIRTKNRVTLRCLLSFFLLLLRKMAKVYLG